MKYLYKRVLTILLLFTVGTAYASNFSITASIVLEEERPKHGNPKPGVVAWLEPLDNPNLKKSLPTVPHKFRLIQYDRKFRPHFIVVPVGSKVEFPNRDNFFHNVFSPSNGKPFDLGLYEGGTSRQVSFDKEGIFYILCNIHPEMSAVVVALNTPYFATPDGNGTLNISGVPAGRYRLRMWIEGATDEAISNLTQEIKVNDDVMIGVVNVKVSSDVNLKHLNKYGVEYDNADSPYSDR